MKTPNVPYVEPNHKSTVMTTRIDLYQTKTGLVVNKFAAGWTASTPPWSHEIREDWTLAEATAWLRENDWTVREWPNGARGWKGPMLPVRSHGQILRHRDRLRNYPDPAIQAHAIDLAYDL